MLVARLARQLQTYPVGAVTNIDVQVAFCAAEESLQVLCRMIRSLTVIAKSVVFGSNIHQNQFSGPFKCSTSSIDD